MKNSFLYPEVHHDASAEYGIKVTSRIYDHFIIKIAQSENCK